MRRKISKVDIDKSTYADFNLTDLPIVQNGRCLVQSRRRRRRLMIDSVSKVEAVRNTIGEKF